MDCYRLHLFVEIHLGNTLDETFMFTEILEYHLTKAIHDDEMNIRSAFKFSISVIIFKEQVFYCFG